MKNSFFSSFGATCALLLAFSGRAALGQDWAKARLEKSSRHGEWVQVKHGDRTIKAFVVYPESKDKTSVLLVIHEIFGLTDWVRSLEDQIAEAGYIAIAPDLLSGQTFSDIDEARKAISGLPKQQVAADLDATADYALKLPAGNGRLAACGFCWGGDATFAYANRNPKLKTAYVFYGTGPSEARDVVRIPCPVYGFYGENDARVNATIPRSEELMQAAGKKFEPMIYAGAGHGFMREGEAPDALPASRKARDDAWVRWKSLLKQL
ncbi:MAG: dienelactone hydrolase family protein [Verrucomicrobiota bacterium]|nr:dienelactone hydrolase family protein [Verrucomicrobiota bacterium]